MDLEQIVINLHARNFGEKGLIRFAPDGSDYNFGCLKDGMHKESTVNVCHECDPFCNGKAEFTRISHGAHTFDFLDAHGVGHETVAGWSQVPVLFVMENPAKTDENDSAGFDAKPDHKRLVKTRWHWIESQYGEPNEKFIFPNYFDKYWVIYSAIRTFKMANAYVTNMVKCGMTDGKNYLTTDVYPEGIALNCAKNFLQNELKDLCGDGTYRPIVFTFGDRTYKSMKELFDKGPLNKEFRGVEPVLLPHPSHRYLSTENRQLILFGKILRTLLLHDFYKGVDEPDFKKILCN